MIRGAFQHFFGIGQERLRILHDAGIDSWIELSAQPRHLLGMASGAWDRLRREIEQCERALQADDLHDLVKTLHPADHWRILACYLDRCSYFDIETTGLGCDSEVTVISCLHRGRLQAFVNGENLDEFLDLLDDADLLVSFNGNSFDVPHVARAFNIPGLPCGHLDLRWACYHQSLRGGLKEIEQRLGITRPPELQGVGGAEAIILWNRWALLNDAKARQLLITYCNADVIALQKIARMLLSRKGVLDEARHAGIEQLWYDGADCDPALDTNAVHARKAVEMAPEDSPPRSAAARLQERLRQRRRNGQP